MGFIRNRVLFNGFVNYVETEAYLDAAGTLPLFRYQSVGPYTVQAESASLPNTYEVDLVNTASIITLLSEPAPGLLEALGLDDCGLTLNLPVDVSNGCSAPLFAVADCVDLDIVEVGPDQIRFGQGGTDRCAERPTDLGNALARIDSDFGPLSAVGSELLREAIVADAYDRLDAILTMFEAEAMSRPNDPEFSGEYGIAHFWKLAQFDRAVQAGASPEQAQFHAAEQIRLMSEAASAESYDPRIDSWLGGTLRIVGEATSDIEATTAAEALLERGLTSYLEFNGFTVGLLRIGLAPDDPNFGSAVEPFLDILDACTDGAIDRALPNYAPFTGEGAPDDQRPACQNSRYAPYNLQGFMLFAGDAALLDGKPSLARTLYENAPAVDGWNAWPFRELIETRLATDLADWSDRARDAIADNDPPLVMDDGTCSLCHAAR